MATRVDKVIADFLAANPQFARVEWLPDLGDLTVWYKAEYADPGEPFCQSEFVKYTPTWLLLEKLTDDLEECDSEDDEDAGNLL